MLWKVVYDGHVNVTSARSVTSTLIGRKSPGSLVAGTREGKWLRLFTGGYMQLSVNSASMLRETAAAYQKVLRGTCADAGKHPINEGGLCEAAASALGLKGMPVDTSTAAGRPEGCYMLDGSRWELWLGTNPANKGRGADEARKPLCYAHAELPIASTTTTLTTRVTTATTTTTTATMTPTATTPTPTTATMTTPTVTATTARTKTTTTTAVVTTTSVASTVAAKNTTIVTADTKVNTTIVHWQPTPATSPANKPGANPSLFCFSVARAIGYEAELMEAQHAEGVSIFNCDEYTVVTVTGKKVVLGYPWKQDPPPDATADSPLTTSACLEAWSLILQDGGFRYHDWIVKVEPDAVFFPKRLRQRLRPSILRPDRPARGSNVFFLTCDRDVGAPTMLSSVEVLSRGALDTYGRGAERCRRDLPWRSWGEETFMQKCLESLMVGAVFDAGMLGDSRCHPAPCTKWPMVAFHNFSSVGSYFKCWGQAQTH